MLKWGAKAGIFCPDEITENFVKSKNGEYSPILPDDKAIYSREIVIDVEKLEPLIAVPHGFNIQKVSDFTGRIISQAL